MKTLLQSKILLLLVAPLVFGACERRAEVEDELEEKTTKTEPGPMTTHELANLGSTIEAPDTIEIVESQGEVRLVDPAMPEITITVSSSDRELVGRQSSMSMGTIEAKLFVPGKVFTCKAEDAGESEKLVRSICDSLEPAASARMKDVRCEEAEGFEKDTVTELWSGLQDELLACAKLNDTSEEPKPSMNIGFNVSVSGGTINRNHWASPTWNEAGRECFEEVWDEVRPKLPDGVTEGKVRCGASYSRY